MRFPMKTEALKLLLEARSAHASVMAAKLTERASISPDFIPSDRPNGAHARPKQEIERDRDAWLRDAYDASNWLAVLKTHADDCDCTIDLAQLRWLFKHVAPESIWPTIGELKGGI